MRKAMQLFVIKRLQLWSKSIAFMIKRFLFFVKKVLFVKGSLFAHKKKVHLFPSVGIRYSHGENGKLPAWEFPLT